MLATRQQDDDCITWDSTYLRCRNYPRQLTTIKNSILCSHIWYGANVQYDRDDSWQHPYFPTLEPSAPEHSIGNQGTINVDLWAQELQSLNFLWKSSIYTVLAPMVWDLYLPSGVVRLSRFVATELVLLTSSSIFRSRDCLFDWTCEYILLCIGYVEEPVVPTLDTCTPEFQTYVFGTNMMVCLFKMNRNAFTDWE